MKTALHTAPKVDRLRSVGRAASLLADAGGDGHDTLRVDRSGGRYGAGIIRGVSLCSRGEALGHDMWCDSVMLSQIHEAAQTNPKGLKSRFTHPDWCSDGMGKGLGTIEDTSLVGDQVYGDLHFYESAHKAPDGDLAEYVMSLAEEDPENFGLSIVFAHDWEAEDAFEDEHTQEIELSDDTGTITTKKRRFVSPDPLNVRHLPHARLSELRAADVVDEPAANPKGLFHRDNAMLTEGGQMIDFILGRSQQAPALSALGVDVAPERLRDFISKHLAKAGLSLTSIKETAMATKPVKKLNEAPTDDEEKKPEGETKEDEKPDEDPKPKDDDKPFDEDEKKDETEAGAKSDLAKFCDTFGHEAGAKFFLAGTSFEAAQSGHIKSLTAQLSEANAKLAAFAKSGVEPVAFTAAGDKQRDKTNGPTSASEGSHEIDNRTRFAAANAATETKV